MSFELTEREDGRVFVQIRSTRGAGTDDRDHVTVSAIYDDITEAENESHRLNGIAKDRLVDARKVGADGDSRPAPAPESNEPQVPPHGSNHDSHGSNHTSQDSGHEPGPENSPESNAASGGEAEPIPTPPTREVSDPNQVSKVYLGDGAETGGWVSVPTEIVLDEIVPLVTRFETEEEHVETIFVNFSKDIPASGWTNVDAGVVTNRIEPIIDAYRVDPD